LHYASQSVTIDRRASTRSNPVPAADRPVGDAVSVSVPSYGSFRVSFRVTADGFDWTSTQCT